MLKFIVDNMEFFYYSLTNISSFLASFQSFQVLSSGCLKEHPLHPLNNVFIRNDFISSGFERENSKMSKQNSSGNFENP